ncbi:MAG: HtaA domain-containing protein, partial [Actinomycetota bacterium]|nr:HtaA domain-containing protein [Actinomycetota bacterium]
MDGNRVNEDRKWLARGIALGALACIWLLAAPAAMAAPGHGSAELLFTQHAKGRTLSAQGVKVIAGPPAQQRGNALTLPISSVETGAAAAATSDGWLRFKRGKRGIVLSALRFDLTAGTLSGKLGSEEIAVFQIATPAPVQVNPVAGTVALSSGKLRLTAEAASALKQRLGLERALVRKGVGVLWLSAQVSSGNPAPNPAQPEPPKPSRVAYPVVAGQADWGVLASWRKYILGNMPPGSAGTITTADGATANGTLSEPSGYFGFPEAGGSSFEKGLNGATDRLVLETEGSVTFAKPMHCIIEVKLADLVVTLDGASSSIVLDSVYDIDTPPGCADQPAVPSSDVDFASLDLSGVTPVYSEDGKTVTWSAIPATLTAEGSTAFGLPQYEEGQALDPLTVRVD